MGVEIDERAEAAGDHVVQFYESEASLAAVVGRYLRTALQAGETAIVIATEAHREAFGAELALDGIDLAAAQRRGTLVSHDAAATLARFTTEDGIDAAAFREVVGGIVRDACGLGRPVRAYGEMVALLWEAGDVHSAVELETLWNELGRALPFSLLCAYPSQLVSGDEHSDALDQVCHLHSSVIDPVQDRSEQTGLRAEFAPVIGAPGDARRLVVEALRRHGHDEAFLDDAALVLTELATNAVVHARTPFSVTVRGGDGFVRICVCDGAPDPPRLRDHGPLGESGRGLLLIEALASRWGSEATAQGKAVWAELSLWKSRG